MARGGSYAGRGGLPRPAHRGEYGKITQEPRRRGVTAATAACVARREAQRRGNALAQLLNDEVQTLPELALRFCLSSPHVSTVIPGMRRAAHVRQNVAAAEKGRLMPGMLSKFEAHAWEKNWYR